MREGAQPSVIPPTETRASIVRVWLRRAWRSWRTLATGIGFASLGALSLLLSLLVLPLLRLFPGSEERKGVRAQRAIHWFVRGYLAELRLLGILRIECSGTERLREPGSLVVANHPTLLDALVLIAYMPQATCVVKQRYYDDPFLGGTARAAGYVPSRDGPGLVEACVERLIQGRSLIIFPEGTRSPVGGLRPFARGAAHIALRSGRDPLPVTITCQPPTLHHAAPWWMVPERRFTLRVSVGEPLPVKQIVGEHTARGGAARALTAALRAYFGRRLTLGET